MANMIIQFSGIILCMRPANERRHYIVTSSLIGWVHTQNDPCFPEFSPHSPVSQLILFICHHLAVLPQQVGQRVPGQVQNPGCLASVKHVHHVDPEITLKPLDVMVCTMENLQVSHKLESLHDYPYHWVILDPKSKGDKVKVTNFKNSPKFQIFEFPNKHYTRHTLWSCSIRCANMKWIP